MTRMSPEYLFLVDRSNAGDQQARLIDRLVSHLQTAAPLRRTVLVPGRPARLRRRIEAMTVCRSLMI